MVDVENNIDNAMDETVVVGPLEAMSSEVLDKLVDRLPERLRPLAGTYGPVLVKMTVEQIEAFLMGALTDPVEEYKRLHARLGNDEAIAAGKVLSEYWEKLNTQTWNVAEQQRLAMGELAGVGAMMLLAVV